MKSIVTLLLSFAVVMVYGQKYSGLLDDSGKWIFGVKAGGTYSSIGDIKSTIIREWFDESTYSTEDNFRYGFTGGIFFYHRFKNSIIAMQPEFTYSILGGDFHYSDNEGLEYDLNLKYHYLNLLPLFVKVSPFHNAGRFLSGFNLGVGPQIGINLTPTNLTYKSNKPDLGPDLQIQQNLRGVLKGKLDLSAALGLGYELKGKLPITIEARANLGLTDTFETLANGYNFIENRNQAMNFSLSIGYCFPMGDGN